MHGPGVSAISIECRSAAAELKSSDGAIGGESGGNLTPTTGIGMDGRGGRGGGGAGASGTNNRSSGAGGATGTSSSGGAGASGAVGAGGACGAADIALRFRFETQINGRQLQDAKATHKMHNRYQQIMRDERQLNGGWRHDKECKVEEYKARNGRKTR